MTDRPKNIVDSERVGSLRAIALEVLGLYRRAEDRVIYEYSGEISEDIKALDKEVAAFKKQIEEA